MTVRELIEKLNDMPQDYIVEVYRHDELCTDGFNGYVAIWDSEHGVVCIS